MMTEKQAREAVANRDILAADLAEPAIIGQAVGVAVADDEMVIVRLVADGTDSWVDALYLTWTAGLARCGRCSKIVPTDTIDATGPYLTCPPCTPIIRS